MTATMFDKIWDMHVVEDLGNGVQLLHVDRHLMHELSGQRGQLERQQGQCKRTHIAQVVPRIA